MILVINSLSAFYQFTIEFRKFRKKILNSCCLFTGLIELATPIILNDRIQPIKLPNKCQKNLTDEPLIAIGNGLNYFDIDKMVRPLLLKHAYYNAVSFLNCIRTARYGGNPHSILCILPREDGLVHLGDSGIIPIHNKF